MVADTGKTKIMWTDNNRPAIADVYRTPDGEFEVRATWPNGVVCLGVTGHYVAQAADFIRYATFLRSNKHQEGPA